MRKLLLSLIIIALSMAPVACQGGEVKEPSVAGAFYSADEGTLRSMVKGFLDSAKNEPVDVPVDVQADGELLALISPHAGLVFSGQVAAYGFKHLADKPVDTVILIGPSHHSSFRGASVYDRGSFKTPLGLVRIDEKLAKSLIDEKSHVVFNPEPFQKEHSLEVQIPFLQSVLKGKFKIVPIIVGVPTQESFDRLVRMLAEIVSTNKRAIIVASTDLSHYHDYQTAQVMDAKVVEAMSRLSVRGTERLSASGEAELCGVYPVLITIEAARMAGASYGKLFKYANSGDVVSDKKRVVGYASIGLFRGSLTKEEKEELLGLARSTVAEYVKTGKVTDAEITNRKLLAEGAAFVTINRNGSLRGCIGHIHPVMSLYESVRKNAVAASSMDPRFPPMSPGELNDIEVEISVLSPLVPLKDPMDVVVGRDGLYIMKDGRGGILLPQVPVAFGWNREEFLKQVSMKAGLPPDAWKQGATLLRFSAEVIK